MGVEVYSGRPVPSRGEPSISQLRPLLRVGQLDQRLDPSPSARSDQKSTRYVGNFLSGAWKNSAAADEFRQTPPINQPIQGPPE